MQTADYVVVALFFVLMVYIGLISYRKIKATGDFFVAGGKVPWWLGGISHHVSGYSGVVFVAYAAVAYEYGFTLYIWWAVPIALACFIGAFVFAPRWCRLRQALHIESPTEYLKLRYNVPTQQVMAWSGVVLKLFDAGAKWASIGILLHGFTGLPLATGILLSGGISLVYITVGGLWADLYTDLAQFVVQVVAGVVLFVAVVIHLGGSGSVFGVWDQLPEGHAGLFNGPYGPPFFLAFLLVAFLSYNGGTWNLAARYIAAPSAASARKSALLSGGLYLVWPLILFFPMWAAPLLVPGMENPSQSYAELTQRFLPAGLVGLVLASMFANTMSMTTSDTNTISAVITRDILPLTSRRFRDMPAGRSLMVARVTTFCFTALTLVIALEAERFGGVLGLILSWFGALVGPVSIPMLLGLIPGFRHAGPGAAISSTLAGFATFLFIVYGLEAAPQFLRIGGPAAMALLVFAVMTFLRRGKPLKPEVESLMKALSDRKSIS